MNQNINPKSLKGKDVFSRTLDLMNKLTPINESVVNYSLEFVKRAPNGIVYTIIRENHKYFIKTTENIEFKLSELEYTGGLQNKMSESYSSYEQALKHLNMKFQQLNELYDIKGGYNLFEQDEVETEETDTDQEGVKDKKYKLKVSAGSSEPSAPAPSEEMPIPDFGGGEMESPEISDAPEGGEGEEMPSPDMGTEDMPEMPEGGEGEDIPEMGTEEDEDDIDIDEEEDPKKYIQKLTGRLGQKLRELSEVDPKLEKYVINSIISALHVDKMDKKDRIDIMKKFKKKKGMESVMSESQYHNRQSVIDHYANVIDQMDMNEEEASVYLEDQGLDYQIVNTILEYVFPSDSGMDEYYGGQKLDGPFNFEKLKSRSSDENGMMRKSMRHKPMRFKKHQLDMDSDEQWQVPVATAVGSAIGSYFAGKDENMDEKLYGGQHNLDLNKNHKLDREDFRMLRSKKKRSSDESKDDSESMNHKKKLADALKRIREKRKRSADERFDDMRFRSVSGGRDGGDTEVSPDIEIDEPLTPPLPKYPDPFNPEVPETYPQPKAGKSGKEKNLTFESIIKKYRKK
jgi:hypothetical protein